MMWLGEWSVYLLVSLPFAVAFRTMTIDALNWVSVWFHPHTVKLRFWCWIMFRRLVCMWPLFTLWRNPSSVTGDGSDVSKLGQALQPVPPEGLPGCWDISALAKMFLRFLSRWKAINHGSGIDVPSQCPNWMPLIPPIAGLVLLDHLWDSWWHGMADFHW